MENKVTFEAGRNIAMKVPAHQYDATVQFYCDVLGFNLLSRHDTSVAFEFGTNRLWIDSVVGLSQAEIWLEVVTQDMAAAARLLSTAGIVRCDDIEPLPQGLNAFWISNPASIIHLICTDAES